MRPSRHHVPIERMPLSPFSSSFRFSLSLSPRSRLSFYGRGGGVGGWTQAEKLKEIKELFAYHLFAQGQYERAMGFFSQLNTDPLQVSYPHPHHHHHHQYTTGPRTP